jgi:hypothetical protein
MPPILSSIAIATAKAYGFTSGGPTRNNRRTTSSSLVVVGVPLEQIQVVRVVEVVIWRVA